MNKKVLITGAYGFIGSQVTGRLIAEGYTVVAAVHDIDLAKKHLPDCTLLYCDFSKDIHPNIWIPRLKNIDMVVNCVGILQSHSTNKIEAIHYIAPRALIEACKIVGVHKVVHISATGADESVDIDYARTKWLLEKFLKSLDYNWVILRPSLVYSSGSYGGTSLFRALASLPWCIPVVGAGKQLFQPIAMEDLSKAVQIALEKPSITQQIISIVGPDRISIADLLVKVRKWLGFGSAKIIHVPLYLVRIGAFLGDWFKDIPINTTTYKMLAQDNIANVQPFIEKMGFIPQSFDENLIRHPSSIQDRWHARLYFLNPLLRVTLGLLWIFSGLIPLFLGEQEVYYTLLYKLDISNHLAKIGFYLTTSIDILLGIATLVNWKLKWVGTIQIILIILYTITISWLLPEYWLDPFGAVLKNIPLVVATMVMLALSESR